MKRVNLFILGCFISISTFGQINQSQRLKYGSSLQAIGLSTFAVGGAVFAVSLNWESCVHIRNDYDQDRLKHQKNLGIALIPIGIIIFATGTYLKEPPKYIRKHFKINPFTSDISTGISLTFNL